MRAVFSSLVVGLVVVLGVAAVAHAAPQKSAVASLHAEARRIVDEWREAQNRADEKAYVALYEQKQFRGVKRASKGTTRYDWAGWSTDRLRMMKTRPTVATENVKVTTWLEKKSLKKGIVEVRFTQRWKNSRYADHGIKLLLLVRNQSGGLRILYEDLLDSHPGWLKQKIVRKSGGDGGFATPDEAWAKLEARAPTLDQVDEVIGSLATDDNSERLLARAILAKADPACKEIEEISECGDERREWKTLDPKLEWKNACTQRKAVQWALDATTLTKQDVGELFAKLAAIVALPLPEEELIGSAITLIEEKQPARRLDLLAALIEGKRLELANEHTKGLTPKNLERAAADLHLDDAALALSEKTQRAAVLAALADDQLAPKTRLQLLERVAPLKGADVDATLVELSEKATHCELSMGAALQLEERGKKQYLPKRGDDRSLSREICRNFHDSDDARRQRFWKSLFPPTGKVEIVEHLDDDWAERDEAGNKLDKPDEVRKVTRKTTSLDDLDEVWGAGEEPKGDKVDTSDGYIELTFETGKDGKVYLAKIYRYRWRGCPC